MANFKITDERIINQLIDETSTTKNLPLGTVVRAKDATLGEAKFVYAAGTASTVVGSVVSIDDTFATTLSVADGKYRLIAVAMSINVAGPNYGWYQISGKAVVKALAAFADNADCYLTSTAGSIDDAIVAGDFIYGMKGASAVDTPSTGLAYVQLGEAVFSLNGDTLDDATFLGTVSIGQSGSAGVFYIFPATAASGKLIVTVQDQTGDTAVTLDIDEHGQATTVNLPDSGLSASYLMQSTAQVTIAEADVLDGATSTQTANKVVIADANVNIDVVKATALHIGATGSEVQVVATPKEINDNCDASTRVVASVDPATLAITSALHAAKIIYLTDTDGAALTLPAATGTGDVFMVLLAAAVASNSTTIKAASAADSFLGACLGVDDDADAAYAWKAETADDTVTYDGTATGGAAGDWMKFTDVATGLFLVEGQITQSGASEATPFSATVS